MPQQKPFTPDDLFRLRFLADPRISPDGERVVYVERRIDPRRDAYVSHLWLVPFAGGKPRRLTRGNVRDSSPRWSPDGGTILFVREADKRHQLLSLAAAPLADPKAGKRKRKKTGARKPLRPRVLLDTRGVPSSPCWSPDGRRIAFVFRPLTAEEREARRKPPERQRIHPRVIRRLFHREDGRGFLPDERGHVWVMERNGKRVRRLTSGEAEDHSPLWSPDGRTIVFMSNRIPRADYWIGNMDLWAVPAGGGESKPLTEERGPFVSPAFSPDGATIAFFGNLDPLAFIERNLKPRSISAAGGISRDLAPAFDRTCTNDIVNDMAELGHMPQAPVWFPNGSWFSFLVSDRGACGVFRLAAEGGDPEPVLTGPHEIASFTASTDGRRCALLVGTAEAPHEVYGWELAWPEQSRPAGLDDLRALTQSNARLLAKRRIAVPEEIEISVPGRARDAGRSGRDGGSETESPSSHGSLHGWILRPLGFDETRRYPLVLAIHGGPMAMYGWSFVLEFQILAGAGFAVLFTNPRGSQGYGEDHCLSIRGDWGNLDYIDLMAAADWAERQSWLDGARMGVCGGSYGGFMTNWIVGHSQRFRAAVADRSISNLHSMYGSTDFGWDFGWSYGAQPWEDPQRFLRGSPLSYVEAIRTPLLLVHSEMDLRCSVDQADQLFTALNVLEREVEYVRYPKQSHGLSRSGTPTLRRDRLERYLDWFRKHLREGEREITPEERRAKERAEERAPEEIEALVELSPEVAEAKSAGEKVPAESVPAEAPLVEKPDILPGR
jgi:dipeptidyl aminopeptidase/acylaminoacyl peptidase